MSSSNNYNTKRSNRNSGASLSDKFSKLFVDKSLRNNYSYPQQQYRRGNNHVASVVNAMNKPSLLSQSLFVNNHHPQLQQQSYHHRYQNQGFQQTFQPFLFIYLPINPAVLPNLQSTPAQPNCQIQLSRKSMFQGDNLYMFNNR